MFHVKHEILNVLLDLKYNILKFNNYYDNIFLCSTWNIEENIL